MPLYQKKKNADPYKYGYIHNPNSDAFMGPVTLAELKKSVEVENEVVRKRLAKKKAEAEQAKLMQNEQTKAVTRSSRTPKLRSRTSTVDSALKENVNPSAEVKSLVKLSDTFITDLDENMVLNATIPDEETETERAGTPDIFRRERNDSWKNSPKRSPRSKPLLSRTPLEESMSFFAKSPTSVRATVSFPQKTTRLLPKSPRVLTMPSIKIEEDEDADGPLDRTFEFVEDETRQPVLGDITRLHYNLDETKLVDLSTAFAKSSMKPPKPVAASRLNKCLLDETLNLNESKIGGRLRTPLIDKVTRSRASTRVNSASKENEEPVVGTPRVVKLSDTFITDLVGDTLLNVTVTDDETSSAKRAGTPDVGEQERNDSLRRSARSKLPTQRSTAARVTESTRLFAMSPAPVTAPRSQSKKKTAINSHGTLFAKSPAVLAKPSEELSPAPVTASRSQSKKKTAVNSYGTLFARSPAMLAKPLKENVSSALKEEKRKLLSSPVANYIHRGTKVQSMSKARHSACIQPSADVRSQSDNKGVPISKIPISLGGNAKRKLNLGEMMRR